MRGPNISEWGLANKQIVLFLLIILSIAGAISFTQLGQSEDPPFTFKVMLIRTAWPGATAAEIDQQITDKIETKISELGYSRFIRSYSQPGESIVLFIADDSINGAQAAEIWYQVRKKIGDIRYTFPEGVQGPAFNDEFGDTFGNIFVIRSDDFSQAEIKPYAEKIRSELLRIHDIAKVDYIGEQERRIYVEIDTTKLANLGIALNTIAGQIHAINSKQPGGFYDTNSERIWLRPSANYNSLADVAATPIGDASHQLRLGDIARISFGYQEPAGGRLRYMGKDALGLGVSMRAGGDIIRLGNALDSAIARIQQQLPLGIHLDRLTDQPRTVRASVSEFIRVLTEAVVIVLAVSLISLGLRTGIVVAISIPIVLAMTFLVMNFYSIGLHKISLGALVVALGLLVDDAIISVEMMASKMEQGMSRLAAAGYAYRTTAGPMLSGTLVTITGFVPIALAASSTGEYTRAIFQVTAAALILSWIAAVLFVPYLGFYLLPDYHSKQPSLWQKLLRRPTKSPAEIKTEPKDLYQTPFYRKLRKVVQGCVEHRYLVIIITILIFILSVIGMRFVPQQFFPDSTRPELLINVSLVHEASPAATEQAVLVIEQQLAKMPELENYAVYVGTGSPRFYLPLDIQLPSANFAQFVLLAKSTAEREKVRSRLIEYFNNHLPQVRTAIYRLENGPPVGFPVQFRLSGPDRKQLLVYADKLQGIVGGHKALANVHSDTPTAGKVINIKIDEAKVRRLGINSADINQSLEGILVGRTVSYYHTGNEQIAIIMRADEPSRKNIELLANLPIQTPRGVVTLNQLASFNYVFEDQLLWRRDRVPTITVRANLYGTTQASRVVADLTPQIDKLRQSLPIGYHLNVGGAVEESAQGSNSVMAGMPILLIIVLSILMFQLRSFADMTMVLLSAPLGLIGVVLFLFIFRQPFGFVAMLGTIALFGMIMRNAIILVDQIRQDIASDLNVTDAIVESTVRRFRPIVLTAMTAILAMIPLTRSAFFGPMATAIMGGLLVATILTVLFLPALYALWHRAGRRCPSGTPT